MTIKELTYLLHNPAKLRKEQTDTLEQILKEFPYFQSIRSLVLKGLKDQESFRYNQELKVTAAYTTDRSVLFDFITSTIFIPKNNDKKENEKTNIEVIDPEEADNHLSLNKPDETLNTKVDSIHKLGEHLQINKPFDFNKSETHSFNEWLKLSSLHPIDRKTNQNIILSETKQEDDLTPNKLDNPIPLKNKLDLIDEFIANNPKIQPVDKNSSSRHKIIEHSAPPDELMTETLARIYLAQKNYKKAIQAYKILILKYPEKSGFFADQIRSIEKIQDNK